MFDGGAMPVRFDQHLGSLEILPSERTAEGFLKVHGIAARTGVLYYQDVHGGISAELIPPDELINAASLETIGGKPFVNGHPRDANGMPVLVTPENATDLQKGTVGNDVAADPKTGFVRVTIDVHDAETIAQIDAGKVQLSSGRTIDRLDNTPGIWDPKTQQYWIGDAAAGRQGIGFDKIQRGLAHNHLSLEDRGRAGDRVALRMDSADGIEVEPPNNGGRMAKVRLDGAEYEVDSGFASAFSIHQASAKARVDGLTDEITTLKAQAVKVGAERDAAVIKADAAQATLDATDVNALVAARVALVASVAHLKIDGIAAMSDRQVQVTAIKAVKADYSDDGVSDEHVAIYFDAMVDLGSIAAPKANDGRGGVRSARNDASPDNGLAARRKEFAMRGDYRHEKRKAQGRD